MRSNWCNVGWAAVVGFVVFAGTGLHAQQDARERSLVELANQARQEAGLKPLAWDAGLGAAAHAHAERMATEGPIAHRYGGEPDLPERAATAGAHFSLIEENIAVADSALHVHQSWMKSPPHHDNLMNPKIDHIGVALVPAKGVLYAVADYAVGVDSMSFEQVEESVAKVVAQSGLHVLPDAARARQYCAQEDSADKTTGSGVKPRFLMRWQSADIVKLPAPLAEALASKKYSDATVGACEPQGRGPDQPVFSGYRVAVLLY